MSGVVTKQAMRRKRTSARLSDPTAPRTSDFVVATGGGDGDGGGGGDGGGDGGNGGYGGGDGEGGGEGGGGGMARLIKVAP